MRSPLHKKSNAPYHSPMKNSSMKDIAILIALIVVVILSWITGTNKGITGQPTIPGVSLEVTRSNTSFYGRTSASNASSDVEEAVVIRTQTEIDAVEYALQSIELFSEKSPYEGMVTIDKRSLGPRNTSPEQEYIRFIASRQNSQKIPISGWRIESVITGRSLAIPEASYLPRSGVVNNKLPVWLEPGDTVILSTGRSPIGVSFRTNLCTGYFTQFQTFNPSLEERCPDAENEILFYTGDRSVLVDNACIDFVERIGRCDIAIKVPILLSPLCHDVIGLEINYNSCVDHHKDSASFVGNDWRLFLKREEELWRSKRELLKLVDQNGKVVDVYSY